MIPHNPILLPQGTRGQTNICVSAILLILLISQKGLTRKRESRGGRHEAEGEY